MPSEGLLELVSARASSRAVTRTHCWTLPPLDWLTSAGYDATRAFLTDLMPSYGHGSLRLLAVGGTYTSDLPYVDSPDEQIPVAGGTVQIAVVYLTPNYYPAEDGPLDLSALAEQAMHRRDLILARIKPL